MSNIPKLRFPEFSGEWEEKNFYEVFDILQNNTFSRDQLNNENGIVRNIHYGDVLIKYGDYIDCQKEKLPFINLENNLSKYEDTSYVKNGDIIIADTAEDYTAGKVTEICNVKDYKILSGLHTFLCRTKFEFASKFLGYKLNSSSYHNQIAPLVAGTKVYSINRKAIGETTITYPSKAEQQKIADFLSNVDSIITAETKILNTLQKKKKALMQKLFTQQLRFKSDDGTDFPAWEEKKLGEISSSPKYGLNASGIDYDGEHKYLRITDIDEVTHTFSPEEITTPSEFSDDYLLEENDIVFARTGASTGKTYLYNPNDGDLYFAGFLIKFHIKDANARFVFYQTCTHEYEKWVHVMSTRSGQPGINSEEYSTLKIQLPCIEEQQKIADCLSSMDSLIQTQQKVVTTWQQRKKALLQQMFI